MSRFLFAYGQKYIPRQNTKGQDSGYPENEEEEVKKRIVITMVTGLIIAPLAGCGTKTEATDQEVSGL